MLSNPYLVLSNPTMKSILTHSHGLLGIGKGWYKPTLLDPHFSFMHITHYSTYLVMSFDIFWPIIESLNKFHTFTYVYVVCWPQYTNIHTNVMIPHRSYKNESCKIGWFDLLPSIQVCYLYRISNIQESISPRFNHEMQDLN